MNSFKGEIIIYLVFFLLLLSCTPSSSNDTSAVTDKVSKDENCGLRCWLYANEFCEIYSSNTLLIQFDGKESNQSRLRYYSKDFFIEYGTSFTTRIITFEKERNHPTIDTTFSINIEKGNSYHIRLSVPILNEFRNNKDTLNYYFIQTNEAVEWSKLPKEQTFRNCELLVIKKKII